MITKKKSIRLENVSELINKFRESSNFLFKIDLSITALLFSILTLLKLNYIDIVIIVNRYKLVIIFLTALIIIGILLQMILLEIWSESKLNPTFKINPSVKIVKQLVNIYFILNIGFFSFIIGGISIRLEAYSSCYTIAKSVKTVQDSLDRYKNTFNYYPKSIDLIDDIKIINKNEFKYEFHTNNKYSLRHYGKDKFFFTNDDVIENESTKITDDLCAPVIE